MKLFVASLCLAASVDAFSIRSNAVTSTRLFSSPSDVEALRAAAAKAREEADRLSQELGKKVVSPAKQAPPKKSTAEVTAMLPSILGESDVEKQAAQWQSLKESQSLTTFGSANLRTFPVSLGMLEQRTSLTPESLGLDDTSVSLDDFKYATLYVAGGSAALAIASLALLPPNIGATLCYLFALVPILFLGIGSTAPQIIANAIASLKGTAKEGVEESVRRCRHEAAHFCCGYWCGLPIKSYSVDEVAQVEFGVGNRGYTATEVAALAVTALAGLVGEALEWNKAVGAEADLIALEQVFRRSDDFIGAQAQQDITRWGALTAANLLRTNKEQYEKVVEAFSQQKPIEECIAILES